MKKDRRLPHTCYGIISQIQISFYSKDAQPPVIGIGRNYRHVFWAQLVRGIDPVCHTPGDNLLSGADIEPVSPKSEIQLPKIKISVRMVADITVTVHVAPNILDPVPQFAKGRDDLGEIGHCLKLRCGRKIALLGAKGIF